MLYTKIPHESAFWPKQISRIVAVISVAIAFILTPTRDTQAQSRSVSRRSADPSQSDASPPREAPLPRVGADLANSSSSRRSSPSTKTNASAADLLAAEDVSASPFAAVFDDPAPRPSAAVETATLNGVQPGATTARQLTEQWGEGSLISRGDDQSVLGFAIESFPHVEVTMADDRVRTIFVSLLEPLAPNTLVRKLQLEDVQPVNIPDELGNLVGQAFPERGVLFSMSPDGKRVSHILLETIDANYFVCRAEANLQARMRASLADLNFALARDPRNARALWLRAKLFSQAARYDEALADVEASLAVEPDHLTYQLTRGEILGRRGQYDEAAQATKDVLSTPGATSELKAESLCQLGDLLAASPAHDYKLATEHHMAAVKLADPLSIDKQLSVRRAAKQLLVKVHVALANDVACGFWQQKEAVVNKWLDRANAYAEDLIAHEEADPAVRMQVARGALAACAGAEGKVDSVSWAKMALENGKSLVAKADDPWTKMHWQWELGLTLSDGLTSDEARGAVQHTLPNTALTITYLESGAKGRRETPDDVFRLGSLYFRMGSLHAVKQADHKTAVVWYEKAYPLLDRPIPLVRRNEQGRYGQSLVSMGISYWQVGMRDFAVQLTEAGLDHVQEAVNRKLVDEKALAVPYGNLAFMHQTLGHKNEAQTFAQLAAKYDPLQNGKH